jgi:rhodanese-related sulfurtransferase
VERQRGAARHPAVVLAIVLAVAVSCGSVSKADEATASDKFETVRAHIQAWLSAVSADKLLISSADLRKTILDDWGDQRGKFEIVSVRKPDDYNKAGHIPNAINVYWVDILKDESLARLDPDKTLILYCYYGHSSMLSSTILNLLGYRSRSLNFGMMGWNLDALVKEPWDQAADYDVELTVNSPTEAYPPPVIASEKGDAGSIIKEMALKYFSGEGSPVILSSDVKAIVDEWTHKKAEFQIVDVRSRRNYKAGHVPHAVNIPWAKVADSANLKKLDPKRTVIVYSENGQTGQLATTVLSLLGYRAVDMKFGMMDWNKTQVEKAQLWKSAAGYPVERSPQGPESR